LPGGMLKAATFLAVRRTGKAPAGKQMGSKHLLPSDHV